MALHPDDIDDAEKLTEQFGFSDPLKVAEAICAARSAASERPCDPEAEANVAMLDFTLLHVAIENADRFHDEPEPEGAF